MEEKIVYFEQPGKDNTRKLLNPEQIATNPTKKIFTKALNNSTGLPA